MALVLVTGATGRIGSALLKALLARKDTVRAVVRPSSGSELPHGVEKYEFDLSKGALPKEAFDGAHKVIHLAGLVGHYPYNTLVLQNAFATKNLLASCPTYVHRVVMASSISVYGEYKGKTVDESFELKGESDYGKSKLLSETFARAYCESHRIVFLRFGMVYGPGFEEGYFDVLSRLQKGKMKIIGDGKNRLPLLHIDDAVMAILLSLDSRVEPCREYNIVGPDAMTQQELLLLAAKELGVEPPTSSIPVFLAFFAARVAHLLGKKGFSPENIRQLSLDRAYSCGRARKELGFEAKVKLADGLKETVRLYLGHEKKGSESHGQG